MSALLTLKTVLLLTLLGGNNVQGDEQEQVCSADDASCHPLPTWDIHKEHPCNIDILTAEEYQKEFPDGKIPLFYDKPIVLRNPEANRVFQDLSSRDKVTDLFEEATVQLPHADLFSFATNNVTVEDYINSPETSSWEEASRKLYMLTYIKDFSQYNPPPTQADIADSRLGIGALGSGAQWHSHGPGFCEALWGRKHWLLVEPAQQPVYDRKRPSRHWYEYMYANYSGPSKLWECTIHPGDAIYFPNKWWHTTVNLDMYTAFVSQFYETKNRAQPTN